MFKKSLAAVAVLGAFAASSFAADVTLYGKIDAGLKYQNTDITALDGVEDKSDDFTLDSGVGQATRFGIKATEDLGNGYKVSFRLENGFDVDDGEMGQKDRLFGRESSLSIESQWGTLSAGRMGAFTAAAGSYDIVMSRTDAFDGGHNSVLGLAQTDRYDNMITYQTPKMFGLQATAQYSFKLDNKANEYAEGHGDADRYAGLALTYDVGALQTALSYEQILRSDKSDVNDGKIITFGGNYNFDVFKLYAMGQYFEGMTSVLNSGDVKNSQDAKIKQGDELIDNPNYLALTMNEDGCEGYGLHIGSQFDALAGHFDLGVYYVDAKANNDAGDIDGEYFGGVARYIYDLSSRTNLRFALGYDQTTWDKFATATDDWEKDRYFGSIALQHNF